MAQKFFAGKKFFIEACDVKATVKKLVSKHGGILKVQYTQDCIHLAPYDTRDALAFAQTFDHPVYSYKFVIDSNSLGEDQSLNDYLLITQGFGSKKQRLMYSRADEKAMEDYVDEHPGTVSSVKFWEKAYTDGLNKHSPESMRRHWRLVHKEKPFKQRGVIVPISKPKASKTDANKKDIKRRFEKLVKMCLTVSKSSLTHTDIYNVLKSNGGNIEQTLMDFALN